MDGNPRFLPLAEPLVTPKHAERVQQQVLSGFLGPGAACNTFADKLAALVGAKYCVLTVSGTTALSVSALALGLKPGDEILVPAYGVISTINGFASFGFQPRLVDIDRGTGCIDPELLARAIKPSTKAVCFVNFSGHTGEPLLAAKRLCRHQGIPLIEDAACALGQSHEGKFAGSFGDVSITSFSVPKVITTGQGGAIFTNDETIYKRAAAFVDQGDLEWRKTNINRSIGNNLRYTDLQAALGLIQLEELPQRQRHKREVFATLQGILGDALYRLPGGEAPLHNLIFSDSAQALIQMLKAKNISAVNQYKTVCAHPAYAHLADRTFANSDEWMNAAVYLPFGMALTIDDAVRIGEAVRASGLYRSHASARMAA